MKACIDQEPWKKDPSLLPIPWREVSLNKTELTVAVMYDDGWVKPAPPIIRGLKEVAAKLQKAGIKVVEWKPYQHRRGFEIVSSMYFVDGGEEDAQIMNSTGEPWMPLTEYVLKGTISLDPR